MITLFIPFMGPSTNDIYAGKHWRHRKADKDSARLYVANAVQHAGLGVLQERVSLIFRPQHDKLSSIRDTGNYSYTAKLIEDGLVCAGVLEDDKPQFVADFCIKPAIHQPGGPNGVTVEIVPA